MASVLLMAGTGLNALRFLFHGAGPSTPEVQGQASDIAVHAKEILQGTGKI